MSILDDLKMYARFAWGLRGFLRHTITLEEAKAIVRKRLAERETNFLRLVEKGIFGYPRSPYLPLLKLAQIELGDIQNMVRDKGLEDTLRALREAGVYVTFEEFKGREPMVRHGQMIPMQSRDFDNPYLSSYYQAESGGTTGTATRTSIDLDHLAAQAPQFMLAYAAHGLLGIPRAMWLGALPYWAGVATILIAARYGQVTHKWFSPVTRGDLRPSLKDRLATHYVVTIGRLFGASIPQPEPVPLDQAAVVAHWVAETARARGKCMIGTYVSLALRVCIAAREEGLDLSGAVFVGSGEPPTLAKVRQMTQVGAHWVPAYGLTEVGIVGYGCAEPADVNDIHLFKDSLALIQYPRQVPSSGIAVDAFYFTTLLPTAPKLLLNVESDDYGVIEERSCGCPLEACGWTEHLRHIRSFGKLTSEGMGLMGSEMVYILEEVLPARFGGSALDYQLIEEEDEQGFTRLSLLISPRVEIPDERAVIEAVFEELGRGSKTADMTRAIWSQAKTLRVKRMEPLATARGKLIPLRVAKRSERSTDAATDWTSDSQSSF